MNAPAHNPVKATAGTAPDNAFPVRRVHVRADAASGGSSVRMIFSLTVRRGEDEFAIITGAMSTKQLNRQTRNRRSTSAADHEAAAASSLWTRVVIASAAGMNRVTRQMIRSVCPTIRSGNNTKTRDWRSLSSSGSIPWQARFGFFAGSRSQPLLVVSEIRRHILQHSKALDQLETFASSREDVGGLVGSRPGTRSYTLPVLGSRIPLERTWPAVERLRPAARFSQVPHPYCRGRIRIVHS